MPYKSRRKRLTYLANWKKSNRLVPATERQTDTTLPPRGTVIFSANGTKVQCHSCGRWLGNLNTHMRTHGLDADAYKETYDLKRTASLWPPALQAKQRHAAMARDQGNIGRGHLLPTEGRPGGLTNRLQTRIEASEQRRGVYTRGGKRT